MIIALLSLLALGALIYAGYRINMYLYSQGAVGDACDLRDREQAGIDTLPIKVARRMAARERDDGLRYVRLGIVGIIVLVALLAVVAISAIAH